MFSHHHHRHHLPWVVHSPRGVDGPPEVAQDLGEKLLRVHPAQRTGRPTRTRAQHMRLVGRHSGHPSRSRAQNCAQSEAPCRAWKRSRSSPARASSCPAQESTETGLGTGNNLCQPRPLRILHWGLLTAATLLLTILLTAAIRREAHLRVQQQESTGTGLGTPVPTQIPANPVLVSRIVVSSNRDPQRWDWNRVTTVVPAPIQTFANPVLVSRIVVGEGG